MTEPTLSDVVFMKKLVDSLLSPPTNVAKPLGPQATLKAYLDLCSSAYAKVEFFFFFFSQFLKASQKSTEKPSSYLRIYRYL